VPPGLTARRSPIVLGAAVAVALLVTMLVGPAAHARVTSVRSTMRCGGGQVSAPAPGVWTDRNQTVYWAAGVHFWNSQSRRWQPLFTSGWAYAGSINGRVGNSGVVGMPVWMDYGNNAGVNVRTFNVTAGYHYAVLNWFWTQDGGYQSSWAEYGTTGYC